jgi:hypothetical protein
MAFDSREFKNGDLVYGLENTHDVYDRNYYIKNLFQADSKYATKIDSYPILQREVAFSEHKNREHRAKLLDALESRDEKAPHARITPRDLLTVARAPDYRFPRSTKDFASFRSAMAGSAGPDGATLPAKYQDALDAPITNESVRRKDKAGLYWATKIAGRHVHFVLDGIDIAAVVKKSFKGANSDRDAGSSTSKNRSITGSELRWVYRNREDPEVGKYIHFWFHLKHARPPWEVVFSIQSGEIVEQDGASLWAQYRHTVKQSIHDETADSSPNDPPR